MGTARRCTGLARSASEGSEGRTGSDERAIHPPVPPSHNGHRTGALPGNARRSAPWLRDSLWDWVSAVVGHRYGVSRTNTNGYWGLKSDLLRQLERSLEMDVGWLSGTPKSALEAFRITVYRNPERFLDAVEWLSVHRADQSRRAGLAALLAESGSRWQVGGDGYLLERVTAAVQNVADLTFAAGVAGGLLQHAWAAAFARTPHPSDAYRQAVRAVEAASKDIVLPQAPAPTLGTIIAALRDGAGKFTFTFVVDSKVEPKVVLVAMLQMLWTNQYDRHVNDATPLHVSQQEAEAAVLLALTLVQWFLSGHVRRIS